MRNSIFVFGWFKLLTQTKGVEVAQKGVVASVSQVFAGIVLSKIVNAKKNIENIKNSYSFFCSFGCEY